MKQAFGSENVAPDKPMTSASHKGCGLKLYRYSNRIRFLSGRLSNTRRKMMPTSSCSETSNNEGRMSQKIENPKAHKVSCIERSITNGLKTLYQQYVKIAASGLSHSVGEK